MGAATIYNGNRSITFDMLQQITPQMQQKSVKPLPFPHGQGQQVVGVLQWSEIYPFKFLFKTVIGGTIAWDKYDDFRAFLKEESDILAHLRIIFDKPGDTGVTPDTVTLYGKMMNVTPRAVTYPNAIESVEGSFNFAIDDKTDVSGW